MPNNYLKFKPTMKLLLLSMFISCGCFGQYPTEELLSDSNTIFKYDMHTDTSGIYFLAYKTDTVPCIMLVSSDTLHYTNFSPNLTEHNYFDKVGNVFWCIGYLIENHPWQELDNIQYLDADKKPLSKNIIVWISHPLK